MAIYESQNYMGLLNMARKNSKKQLPFTLENCFVAGGAITSIYTNNEINDFDIYPKSYDAAAKAIDDLIDNGWWMVDSNERSVTLKSGSDVVQIIHFAEFPTANSIFDSFDFTVCMGAYDYDTESFVLHDDFLEHCSQRVLVFNPKTNFPYASAWRVRKYTERGFTIGKMEYFKILISCGEKKLTSWDDLIKQLGGAYGSVLRVDSNLPFTTENIFNILDTIEPVYSDKDCTYNKKAYNIALSRNRTPYFISGDSIYSRVTDDNDKICYIELPFTPKNGYLLPLEEVFKTNTFYKKVIKDENGILRSKYDKTFIYSVGEYVSSGDPYIFAYDNIEMAKQHYFDRRYCLIELEVDSLDDIVFTNSIRSECKLKKAKVVRIVEEVGY